MAAAHRRAYCPGVEHQGPEVLHDWAARAAEGAAKSPVIRNDGRAGSGTRLAQGKGTDALEDGGQRCRSKTRRFRIPPPKIPTTSAIFSKGCSTTSSLTKRNGCGGEWRIFRGLPSTRAR